MRPELIAADPDMEPAFRAVQEQQIDPSASIVRGRRAPILDDAGGGPGRDQSESGGGFLRIPATPGHEVSVRILPFTEALGQDDRPLGPGF